MEKKKNNPTKNTYKKISEWLEIYHSETSAAKEKEKAKTLIVTHMYPVVRRIAKTIARRDYDPVEDLTQAGFVGLLKAIDRYNAEVNDNFKVYAGYFIIGEIKHYLRDKLNAIRVPRHIQELSIRIHKFIETLSAEQVDNLTNEEVAKALAVNPKVVNVAMLAERRSVTLSLEDIYKTNDHSLSFEEIIPEENYEEKAAYKDARIIFENVIDKLPPESKVLIDMYYKQDYNKKEIAEALLLTEMSVNRKMKNAFELIANLVVETQQNLLNQTYDLDEDFQ